MKTLLPMLAIIFLPWAALADWKADFQREFLTKEWGRDQRPEDACVGCHSTEMMKPELRTIPDIWAGSWHFQNGISCHNCHGGDPNDQANSMSAQKGFVGTPSYKQVPEFCGKCHVGILKNFLESGHGKALKASGKGPNCVTCHGSHNVQKASIHIISEQLCTRCHSYERVKTMKQALLVTENRMNEIDQNLKELKKEGFYNDEEQKAFFNTQAQFRTLFHSEDVSLIKRQTDEFLGKFGKIQDRVEKAMAELRFRRNFSAFLMLIFGGLALGFFLVSRNPK